MFLFTKNINKLFIYLFFSDKFLDYTYWFLIDTIWGVGVEIKNTLSSRWIICFSVGAHILVEKLVGPVRWGEKCFIFLENLILRFFNRSSHLLKNPSRCSSMRVSPVTQVMLCSSSDFCRFITYYIYTYL